MVEVLVSQAVKMCITPSAPPQGPCIFMGLPLTSMLRLSCGLSEQTIQLGGRGLEVSVAYVCCVVCVFACACMQLRVRVSTFVRARMWSANLTWAFMHAQRGANTKCARVHEVCNMRGGVGWELEHVNRRTHVWRCSCLGDRGCSHH